MLGIFELSILGDEYLCVDMIKMIRGELETVLTIFDNGINDKEMIDIEELYKKSNKFELLTHGEIIEAKNKRVFEKILEIIVKNEEWVVLDLRKDDTIDDYIWKIIIVKEKVYEEIKEVVK